MKGKRGLAAEMAITTMLVVEALCMILLVVAGLMQKTAIKDYTSILARSEVEQVAEDFVGIMCNENFTRFDEVDFKRSHSDFEGDISLTYTGDEESEKLFTLFVRHPRQSVSVKVQVRRKNYSGVWRSELVSWKNGK